MLHPSLAPLIVLGQLRQGSVIEVGSLRTTQPVLEPPSQRLQVLDAARRVVSGANTATSRTATMINQLKVVGFSIGAAAVNVQSWLDNDVRRGG